MKPETTSLVARGAITKGDVLMSMLEDLADLFEQSAANGTPIRAIVGEDPVEFAETFLRNYAEGHDAWVIGDEPVVVVDWWGFAGAGGQALADAYPRARRIVVEPTEGLRERSRKAARAGRPSRGPRRRGLAGLPWLFHAGQLSRRPHRAAPGQALGHGTRVGHAQQRAAAGQPLRHRQAGFSQPQYQCDFAVIDHVPLFQFDTVQRSFKVDRPSSTSIIVMIQKRTTT